MFAEIKAKSAALQSQIASLRQEAAALIKPMLSEFIKQNPQVSAVKWTQYTPYFNDGDQCTFNVHEPSFFFAADPENNNPEDHDGFESYSMNRGADYKWGPSLEHASAATQAACYELSGELQGVSDALEELFGDHVRVIVTADGVSVDEYNHD